MPDLNDDPALNENLNKVCTADYSDHTKRQMALLSEKDISFELIENLLKYIKSKSCSFRIDLWAHKPTQAYN